MIVKKIFINGKLDDEYFLNINKKIDKLLLDSFIFCIDVIDIIGDLIEIVFIYFI